MLIGVIAEELLGALAVTDRTADATDDRFAWPPGEFFVEWSGGNFFGVGPRIYQVGFLAALDPLDETDSSFVLQPDGTSVLTPSNLGVERTFHTYITQDYRGIWPDLIEDVDEFSDFYQSFDPVLVSAFFRETDLVYSANLEVVAIHPSAVHVDLDIIYAPAFRAGLTPNLVVDSDVIRGQIIRRDGDAFVLLFETFDDTDAIYAPLPGTGLAPGVVAEGDLIYAAGQAAFLVPSPFVSDDTFWVPFAFNQLNPSRLVADDLFIGPELRTPGRMGLVVDADIFPVPSIHFAPLLPSLVVEADTIPSVLTGSVPPIEPLDAIVDFEDTVYAPNVIIFQSLAPHLWPDVDNILSVAGVVLGQVWPSPLIVDADTFYTPTLPPTITPNLFAPADVFFTPIVVFDQSVQPDWFVDTDAFLAPSMSAAAGFDGTLAIAGPIMPSVPPLTVIYIEG